MGGSYSLFIGKREAYVSRADGRRVWQGESSKLSLRDVTSSIIFDVQESYKTGCCFDVEHLRSVEVRGEGIATAVEVNLVSTLINDEYRKMKGEIYREPFLREPR